MGESKKCPCSGDYYCAGHRKLWNYALDKAINIALRGRWTGIDSRDAWVQFLESQRVH